MKAHLTCPFMTAVWLRSSPQKFSSLPARTETRVPSGTSWNENTWKCGRKGAIVTRIGVHFYFEIWSPVWNARLLIWAVIAVGHSTVHTYGKLLQSWAETCSKGFVICFLKVPLACLGSMAAAVQPNSLGNSQKTFHKTFGTSCRPILYFPLIALKILNTGYKSRTW